jgi:uncharacterized protein YgiM (DUF1202 family)
MSKQTAVEFYIGKLVDILGDDIVNNLSIEQTNKMHYLSKEAKKLEREQIEDAYLNGTIQFANDAEIINPKTSTDYYEQTYGGNNESN